MAVAAHNSELKLQEEVNVHTELLLLCLLKSRCPSYRSENTCGLNVSTEKRY